MLKKKIRLNSMTSFYIAWVMMVIHICIANSNMQAYSLSLFSYIAMLFFGIKIVTYKKYTLNEIFLMIMLMLWGYLASKSADDMRVLWFAIVLVASKGIDFNKVVKYNFITMLICCIIFILCFIFGVSDEIIMQTTRGIRHSFGMGHPNMFSAYYIILVIQYIYLKFDNLKIRELVVFMLFSLLVYYFTKSITGLFTIILVLSIVFILRFISLKIFNSKIIVLILISGIILFTIIPMIYNSSFIILDKMMTGRLRQANYYYIKYGISFFGSNINADLLNIYTDNILDMGYAKMLINNGVLYYLCVVIGYVVSMVKAYRNYKYNMIALMSCFIIYMFTENVATYIFMNVTMLLFSDILYKNNGILE